MYVCTLRQKLHKWFSRKAFGRKLAKIGKKSIQKYELASLLLYIKSTPTSSQLASQELGNYVSDLGRNAEIGNR
jgi:hypothetical protein